jgi:hypothetical protein
VSLRGSGVSAVQVATGHLASSPPPSHPHGSYALRREPTPAYWTAQQLGAYLNRSPKSVYKMPAAHPDMPCLKLGKTVMFPIDRVVRWLQAQEQGRPLSRRLHALSNPASTNGASRD